MTATDLELARLVIEETGGRAARALRVARGLLQADVERRMALPAKALSKLERGERQWTRGLVELLLEELEASAWEVLVAGALCTGGGAARTLTGLGESEPGVSPDGRGSSRPAPVSHPESR